MTVTAERAFTRPRVSPCRQSPQSWTGGSSGALARLSNRRRSRPGEAPSRRCLRARSQEIREVEGRSGRASGGAGVETDLVGQRWRLERPGRVHMSTAIYVRADPGEPRANGLIVVQPLVMKLALVADGCGHGVVAGHDQDLGPGVRVQMSWPGRLRADLPATARAARTESGSDPAPGSSCRCRAGGAMEKSRLA